MKTAKKAMLLTVCALVLVAATVMGTLAYLTSTDEVKNTFTVGKVAITLDEAKVDEKGQAIKGEGAERVQANSYKLMPGVDVDKDPTVTVKGGSEDCYVRVLITITGNNPTGAMSMIAVQTDNWKISGMNEKDGNIVMEMRYTEKVAHSDQDTVLPAVFTGLKVSGSLDNAAMDKLGEFSIDVVAQAIQADGFADADAAWKAFPTR